MMMAMAASAGVSTPVSKMRQVDSQQFG